MQRRSGEKAMSDILIKGCVQNDMGERVEILISDGDVEDLIEEKAKKRGVKPKQGRVSAWYSPEIIRITVKN